MSSKLPEGWKTVTLEEISKKPSGMYGINASAIEHNDKFYRYLRITDITDEGKIDESKKVSVNIKKGEESKYLLIKNDIVFARTGASVGRNYFFTGEEEPMIFAGFLIKFSLDEEKAVPKYIKYYCLSKEYSDWVKSISTGSTRPNINATMFRNMRLALPPQDYQNFVVDILSILDDKIELNNKINENLEAQAQALFKHWFVDFEFLDENENPYKSSGGAMVESELGMIPEGWEVKSLDEIAEYINGVAIARYRPKKDSDETLPAIKIKELRQGHTDETSDVCMTIVDEKYFINDYDMIFSWSGSLLIDIWTGGKAILNQHLFKVISEKYNQWFYYYWTKHFLDEFIKIAQERATTMGHIKRSHLTGSKALLPDVKTYNKLGGIMQNILDIKSRNKKQNQKLSQLRDTLLPKLMSGKIRIPLES